MKDFSTNSSEMVFYNLINAQELMNHTFQNECDVMISHLTLGRAILTRSKQTSDEDSKYRYGYLESIEAFYESKW